MSWVAVCYSSSVVRCLLFRVMWLFAVVVACLLNVVKYVSLVRVRCSMCVARFFFRLLNVVRCLLLFVCCLRFALGCLLFVALHRLSFVVC